MLLVRLCSELKSCLSASGVEVDLAPEQAIIRDRSVACAKSAFRSRRFLCSSTSHRISLLFSTPFIITISTISCH